MLTLWEDLSGSYGYELIITPVFEFTELFERGVGETNEMVTKQMYTFGDRRGRSLSLRPEGTAGVMRAYLAQGGTGRWKVAYSGPMFRYEQPQGGRRRQFWQIGVECVGSASAAADVEVIVLADLFLSAVGVGKRTVDQQPGGWGVSGRPPGGSEGGDEPVDRRPVPQPPGVGGCESASDSGLLAVQTRPGEASGHRRLLV